MANQDINKKQDMQNPKHSERTDKSGTPKQFGSGDKMREGDTSRSTGQNIRTEKREAPTKHK